MTDPVLMAVIEGLDDLLENDASIFLIVELVLNDSVEEFSPSAQLENQIDAFLVLEIVN